MDKLQVLKYIFYKNCLHNEFDQNLASWQKKNCKHNLALLHIIKITLM